MNVRKKVPESMCSDPDPKLLDLKIANNSLLTLNASLNETIKTQSSKLSSLTSFESMKNVQQLQHDHIAKVEELMRELTGKFSSQELEIKNLKNSLEDKHSKQQQKVSQLNTNNISNESFMFTLANFLILALLYGMLFNLNFENIWALLKRLEYLYSMIQETSQLTLFQV
ncbi:17829_t:CDS:2 [Funneliformis caledonium]|uniref:17829_t:CDS:1 n=1 Tax=Funneliformis caledonium TaxID=1117310 RepID=A0A9N8WN37_9GLOM|nr:17829_t:CDS:2 [Funneliformis caledonium]